MMKIPAIFSACVTYIIFIYSSLYNSSGVWRRTADCPIPYRMVPFISEMDQVILLGKLEGWRPFGR
jgi:hypothetical protein